MTKEKKVSEAEADKKETQNIKPSIAQETLFLEVKPTTVLPDGRHEGIITKIEARREPYGYIDIFIKEKKTEAELRLGFPDTVTERTGLGKFLVTMGVSLTVGSKVDLNKELLARKVSFMSDNEETDKGVFARIIRGTVKPVA